MQPALAPESRAGPGNKPSPGNKGGGLWSQLPQGWEVPARIPAAVSSQAWRCVP